MSVVHDKLPGKILAMNVSDDGYTLYGTNRSAKIIRVIDIRRLSSILVPALTEAGRREVAARRVLR